MKEEASLFKRLELEENDADNDIEQPALHIARPEDKAPSTVLLPPPAPHSIPTEIAVENDTKAEVLAEEVSTSTTLDAGTVSSVITLTTEEDTVVGTVGKTDDPESDATTPLPEEIESSEKILADVTETTGSEDKILTTPQPENLGTEETAITNAKEVLPTLPEMNEEPIESTEQPEISDDLATLGESLVTDSKGIEIPILSDPSGTDSATDDDSLTTAELDGLPVTEGPSATEKDNPSTATILDVTDAASDETAAPSLPGEKDIPLTVTDSKDLSTSTETSTNTDPSEADEITKEDDSTPLPIDPSVLDGIIAAFEDSDDDEGSGEDGSGEEGSGDETEASVPAALRGSTQQSVTTDEPSTELKEIGTTAIGSTDQASTTNLEETGSSTVQPETDETEAAQKAQPTEASTDSPTVVGDSSTDQGHSITLTKEEEKAATTDESVVTEESTGPTSEEPSTLVTLTTVAV